MAKNNRGKNSSRKMHTHTRKRPSNVVRFVDDTVYLPITQWPSFSEESIQRQLGIPVPEIHDHATYVDRQGNAIPWWEFAHGGAYHRPSDDYFQKADATTRYEMLQEPANPSAPYPEDFAPAEWYTYAGGPAYYPSTLEMAQVEVTGGYEAEVSNDGATYYSPRREHFALHPETPEVVEVGGTTYYSPHQRNLDLLVPEEGEGEEGEEYVRGYIEGYHHPQIEHQTRDWWRLFGDTTGELYVLDWVKAMRDEEAERMGRVGEEEGYLAPGKMSVEAQRALQAAMTRHMEGESGEVEEEWSPEKYFAPYRTPEMEDREVEREEEDLGDRVVAWVMETECRGRDDWECQFCGMDCFCRNLSD
jgi:hypothetical protein